MPTDKKLIFRFFIFGFVSETITLIRSLLIALISDNLSSSVLKGGDSFKNVLKSPISFSFNERLFIDTPQLKSTFCFLV